MLPKLAYKSPLSLGNEVWVEEVTLPEPAQSSAGFGASRFTVPPGSCTPAHSHDEREVWFIKRGRGRLAHDGAAVQVSSGDTLYLEPNKSHSIKNTEVEDLEIFSIWWL